MQGVGTVYSTTWEEKTKKATNPVSQIHSTPFGRQRQHDWPGQAVWIGAGSLWLEEARSHLLCSRPMMMMMMICVLNRPFPSSPRPLYQNEVKWYGNDFSFSCKYDSFLQERLCTWPHFESKGFWNSEVAYSEFLWLLDESQETKIKKKN